MERERYFDGSESLECESCEGRGRKLVSEHEEAPCGAPGCCGGFIECFQCADGTPADVVFDGAAPYCLGCIAGGLGLAPRYGLRFTDTGRAWALIAAARNEAGPPTQELPAVLWDEPTEPQGQICEYVPPKTSINDAHTTQVELRAIGGE